MKALEVLDLQFLRNGPYTFHVDRGECVGLSGESGIGKTLLLKAVSDLIPHRGSMLCDGVECKSMEAPGWRSKVCMIPADPVWWHDTVGPHFEGAKRKGHLKRMLQTLGFEVDIIEWDVSRLSAGERQRLGIVRGLLASPSVLLLDEPTSALDPENRFRVEQLIQSLQEQQGVAVLWVGHDYAQLERVSQRILKVKREGFA